MSYSSKSLSSNAYPPVTIKINDRQRYSQVAIVLDNILIRRRIIKLRLKWDIHTFLKQDEYIDWIKQLGKKGNDKYFYAQVRSIRRKFNLHPIFDRVIKNAVLFNEIYDDDYKPTYLYYHFIRHPYDRKDDVVHAIAVTPESTPAEVTRVFEEYQDAVISTRKGEKEYGYTKLLSVSGEIDHDTRDAIERDRGWYWLHKSGLSYLQIAKQTNHRKTEDPHSYKENIRQQVNRYKDLLASVTLK